MEASLPGATIMLPASGRFIIRPLSGCRGRVELNLQVRMGWETSNRSQSSERTNQFLEARTVALFPRGQENEPEFYGNSRARYTRNGRLWELVSAKGTRPSALGRVATMDQSERLEEPSMA